MHRLLEKGGRWVEAARRWMQWNTLNGDRVTWGSHDVLNPPITVAKLEDACAAAVQDYIDENASDVTAALACVKSALEWLQSRPGHTAVTALLERALQDLEKIRARS